MKRIAIVLLWAVKALADCKSCHPDQASHSNSMTRAMEFVEQCAILRRAPDLKFQNGRYRYSIIREGGQSIYSVTDGQASLTAPIRWALGLGSAGQTYIFEHDGKYYESRVSYFQVRNGLDLTIGAMNAAPKNLDEAAGRAMTQNQAKECIACHATDAVRNNVLQAETLVPGVQCGRCHEDAAGHALAVAAGKVQAAGMTKLGRLSTEETSNFCGQCHRTWEQIAAEGPRNLNNVRFQPYRLANSKCYDAVDARIKCTACHDPHRELATKAAAYDSKCEACHADASRKLKVCPVANSGCVTCHMPKYELPGANHLFTDHWIRVARKNASYPI